MSDADLINRARDIEYLAQLVVTARIRHPALHLRPGIAQGRRLGEGYHRLGCPRMPRHLEVGEPQEGRADYALVCRQVWRECATCGVSVFDLVHIGGELDHRQRELLVQIAEIAVELAHEWRAAAQRPGDGDLPARCVTCWAARLDRHLLAVRRLNHQISLPPVRDALRAWRHRQDRRLAGVLDLRLAPGEEHRRVARLYAALRMRHDGAGAAIAVPRGDAEGTVSPLRHSGADPQIPPLEEAELARRTESLLAGEPVLLFVRPARERPPGVNAYARLFHGACHQLGRVAGLAHEPEAPSDAPRGSCVCAVAAPAALAREICRLGDPGTGRRAQIAGPLPDGGQSALIARVAMLAWAGGVAADRALAAARAAAL
ncbi:hypothetical protein [Bailinhaonella thermotolerans]|uniref:Uncharacterized protein n=1 Tax=Bailinhaonella thermotolerans TaxID=1070861 RepID=A0A3A4A1U7_9ACTN|nr:hypothetical protein [Bailinhaonella thermotolerans]RJL21208.1 hypothetical protein D5H75_37715 [Bailinhaonella thermotolerans]